MSNEIKELCDKIVLLNNAIWAEEENVEQGGHKETALNYIREYKLARNACLRRIRERFGIT